MRYIVLLLLLISLSCSKRSFYVQEFSDPIGHLDVGIGSGAFHHVADGKHIVYFVTDRGPNIHVEGKNKDAKVFPFPKFVPSIYKIKISNFSYEILERIELKNGNGQPVSGISNPRTELSYDSKGRIIKDDPDGLDTEAIIKLKDGTFWLSEEYAPSLVHVDKDGKIIKRLVPKGVLSRLKGTSLYTQEKLPEIVAKRKLNRGIEAVAVSPDEKFLYFIIQSPLQHPTKQICHRSKAVRLFRMSLGEEKVDAEYLYIMDDAGTFNDDEGIKQADIKISEMSMLNPYELLVLERAENTTKFYKIDLRDAENILDTKWDSLLTRPALEEAWDEVRSFSKELMLDTSLSKNKFPAKLEGMAYLGDRTWLLVNDNDFGISGQKTKLILTNSSLK